MRRKNKQNWHIKLKWRQKWLILILTSVILGCGFEFIDTLFQQQKVKQFGTTDETTLIPDDAVSVTGDIRYEDGVWISSGGSLAIELPVQYINKIRYYYECPEAAKVAIKATCSNEYGIEEEITIEDSLILGAHNSIVNIRKKVSRIEIPLSAGVRISELVILNNVDFNTYKALFFMAFCALFLFVFLFSDFVSQKIEYGFLFFGLTIGVLFIALQPPRGMSWDEHIHMYKCFDLFETGEISWSESEEYLYVNQEKTEKAPFLSKDEKAIQIAYLNESADHITYSYERSGYSLGGTGYLFVASVMRIGKMLGLSFYNIYLLGKLANLLLYVVIMFLAIRITPICKKTLAVMGLMPTLMILATAYSYDTVVIGFISLGTALLIRELLRPKEVIRWKNIVLIFLCYFVGSLPKILYLPLILLLLALPTTKYRCKRTAYILRGVCLAICILCVITLGLFIAFGVFSGDARGGETSVMGQLQLILQHPFVYAKVLVQNLLRTANEYLLGEGGLAHMAYAGIHKWKTLISLLVFGVLFTESRVSLTADQKKALSLYRKFAIVLVMGVIVLIWTALYLDFTVVGSTVINGVQARYYLPLFLSVFAVLYTDKIKCTFDDRKYTAVVMSIIACIWMQCLYNMFLVPYCL